MTTTQDTEREACRKAFEFDLIDNWMYVESDFALDENGLYADRELYFAWECAWASWQAANVRLGILAAIERAGFRLLKTAEGYELAKLGPIIAQSTGSPLG